MVFTFWVSLHDWPLLSTDDRPFVGMENYRILFADPYFWNALQTTMGIFVLATVPQLFLALVLAHTLNRSLRARTFWRMGVVLPNITSVAAVTLVFGQLFARDTGLVNYLLGFAGVDTVDWQSSRLTSWIAITAMIDWRWTGYTALILLAAMQTIPRDLYEAAALDGAGQWRQLWSVTVPSLRPTILFVVIVATIGGVQLFAEPLLFSSNPAAATGGSGRQFQTLALYLYENAFKRFDFGYAAAIAWVLFGLVVVVSALNFLLARRIRSSD